MAFDDKLIINVALTGMVPTKRDNPHVPMTPGEIAADIRRCRDAGATIFHIHARDEHGDPAYQVGYYEDILWAVDSVCAREELIVCVTTSGRVHNTFEKRSEVLRLTTPFAPDMASLTLGSLNFPKQASVNPPDMIKALAAEMHRRGITPELEVFDLGMIDYADFLVHKGVLHAPFYVNILLGSLGTAAADPLTLAMMVSKLPRGTTWAATGIGRFQFQVNMLAVAMGGHVRVGLEDEIYMSRETGELATNPRLVERIVAAARAMGREPASPAEARAVTGLPQRTWEADAVPL